MDDEQLEKAFTEWFRSEREAQGLSQAEVADRVRMAQQTVAKIEAGTRGVKLGEAFELAEALGFTLNDVVGYHARPIKELRAQLTAAEKRRAEFMEQLEEVERHLILLNNEARALRGQVALVTSRCHILHQAIEGKRR